MMASVITTAMALVLVWSFLLPPVGASSFAESHTTVRRGGGGDENITVLSKDTADANETSYAWPAQEDIMILAHNAIRLEILGMQTALASLVERNALQQWEIDSIQSWWKGHEAHMKYHCINEENHLHPIMMDRFMFPSQIMEEHHKDIQKHLLILTNMIQKLKTREDVMDLAKAWDQYTDVVLHHFQEEEMHGVESCRQHFHAKEWTVIIRVFFDQRAKQDFGAFIHAMGEDDFRNKFMRQRKIPGFVWGAFFKKNLNKYRNTMVKHVEAIAEGVVPV